MSRYNREYMQLAFLKGIFTTSCPITTVLDWALNKGTKSDHPLFSILPFRFTAKIKWEKGGTADYPRAVRGNDLAYQLLDRR